MIIETKDWVRGRNIYLKEHQPKSPYHGCRQRDYEAGAKAVLKAIWKLAEESPTGTFTFDTNPQCVY